MEIVKYKGWRLLVPSEITLSEARNYLDLIKSNDFAKLSLLKENQRSKVTRVLINNTDLVFKIPLEKNTRPWIRFLSLFRTGESFKNVFGMGILVKNNIKTTRPVLAAERRKFGLVVDSWLLYKYLDGEPCLDNEKTYPAVIETLKDIHTKGLLHGDPQIRNFIQKSGGIYVIDSNPKKSGITGFDFGYEWAYLRKSAPGIEQLYGEIKDQFWYKFAFKFDLIDRKIARARKRFKELLKLS